MKLLPLPHIRIPKKILRKMKRISQQQKRNETGGLILGDMEVSKTKRTMTIRKVTGPGKKAKLTPESFEPDMEYLNRVYKRYQNLSYLGEWHKHPSGYDHFSHHDLMQAQQILQDQNIYEMICPICCEKDGKWSISFYYLNKDLPYFVKLSYSVIENDVLSPCQMIVVDKKMIEKFMRKNKIIEPTTVDFYPQDGVCHVFQKPLRKNYQLNLVNAVKQKEMELPLGINVIVYKNDREFAVKAFSINASNEPQKIATQIIDSSQDIFSRHKGILETKVLKNKHVAIIGCGSIGSVAALELVRSGVSNITLVDCEKVAVENICRHVCDLSEIGIAKVKAIRNRILSISPTVKVYSYELDFNTDPEYSLQLCKNADVVLVATDTENSRRLANWIGHELSIPVIYAGLLERATGGRVWRTVPQKTACYECHSVIGEIETKNKIPYSVLNSPKDLTIQPGLGNDIAFITHLAVRYVVESLLEPGKKQLSSVPYNIIFWFNRKRPEWNNDALTIYHVEDVPANKECSFCSISKPDPVPDPHPVPDSK